MSEFLGPYTTLKQLLSLNYIASGLTLPRSRRIRRPNAGLHFSKFKGRGMEFAEVRPYQPGDDVRNIDWKVTARLEAPYTKLFHEERERPVQILCDQSQSMFFGSQTCFKSVKAAHISALIAWAALKHNDRIGGVVFSSTQHREIKPARSRKVLMQLLNCIDGFNNALSIETETQINPDFFNQALLELCRITKPGSLVAIVSDFMHLNEESKKHINKLALHNELVFLKVFDPLEYLLPPAGLYPIAFGEHELVMDTSAAESQNKLADFQSKKEIELEALCLRHRSPLVKLSTHEDNNASFVTLLKNYARS